MTAKQPDVTSARANFFFDCVVVRIVLNESLEYGSVQVEKCLLLTVPAGLTFPSYPFVRTAENHVGIGMAPKISALRPISCAL
jgi:hypothetical protein